MASAATTLTLIGHSTFLIGLGKGWIITDPNYDAAFGYLMPRIAEPPIRMEALPSPLIIAITHSHVDHLSAPTLKRLSGDHELIIPEGTTKYVDKIAFRRVTELKHWQTVTLEDDIAITALPALHSSSRYVLGRAVPTNSYFFQRKKTGILFVGDSGYSETHFRLIGSLFRIDLAVLPIGMATPACLFGRTHLHPRDAVRAFLDLKASLLIPAHYGTFRPVLEKVDWPLREFYKTAQEAGIERNIRVLEFGKEWMWDKDRGSA